MIVELSNDQVYAQVGGQPYCALFSTDYVPVIPRVAVSQHNPGLLDPPNFAGQNHPAHWSLSIRNVGFGSTPDLLLGLEDATSTWLVGEDAAGIRRVGEGDYINTSDQSTYVLDSPGHHRLIARAQLFTQDRQRSALKTITDEGGVPVTFDVKITPAIELRNRFQSDCPYIEIEGAEADIWPNTTPIYGTPVVSYLWVVSGDLQMTSTDHHLVIPHLPAEGSTVRIDLTITLGDGTEVYGRTALKVAGPEAKRIRELYCWMVENVLTDVPVRSPVKLPSIPEPGPEDQSQIEWNHDGIVAGLKWFGVRIQESS